MTPQEALKTLRTLDERRSKLIDAMRSINRVITEQHSDNEHLKAALDSIESELRTIDIKAAREALAVAIARDPSVEFFERDNGRVGFSVQIRV